MGIATAAYVAWGAVVLGIVLVKDGATPDNLTHLAILGWLAITASLLRALRAVAARIGAAQLFVIASVVSAAVVEVCYMITAPLHPSLLVTRETGAGAMLRNVAVDLALTIPAYVLIFALVWQLVRRYDYRALEFTVLVSAGQALGDGMAFFTANPATLLMLPYVMINYHAMSLVPFLATRDALPAGRRRGIGMVVLPLVGLPLVYGIVGTAIVALGRGLGWLPAA